MKPAMILVLVSIANGFRLSFHLGQLTDKPAKTQRIGSRKCKYNKVDIDQWHMCSVVLYKKNQVHFHRGWS